MTSAAVIRSDIVIVGAGLTGLPLAIACAGAGLPTVLIERSDPSVPAADWRTTAVADGARRILEGIGVWDYLAAQAQPILDIRVADKGSRLFMHYDHRSVGETPLGWIVENGRFRAALAARAAALPLLNIVAPAEVRSVERGHNRVRVELNDGRRVDAGLLVAADGKNSRLRDDAGIPVFRRDYRQQSLITTVQHARPHEGVAIEHFLPGGPFAILPLPGNRSSIVWTESGERVAALLALDQASFDREIARVFGDWLGPVETCGPRNAYPLEVMLARRLTAHRLALVGEAAHVLHPIAGQGWNLGLRDVAVLAEILIDAARLGLDLGGADILGQYAAQRQPDILALFAATDGLNRLFSNDIAPVQAARRLGLAAVDRVLPLKRVFMRHAMGLAGQPARLTRGEPL